MLSNVSIKAPALGEPVSVVLDGKELSHLVSALTLRIRTDDIATLTLESPAGAAEFEGMADVTVRSTGAYAEALTQRHADAWRRLLELLGHVQDGSDTTVKLSQDDATRMCIVIVGKKYFVAPTFEQALKDAATPTAGREA